MQRKFDLACFDLDGTLIEEDNGDILWERVSLGIHGTREVSSRRYVAYKKGVLSLEDWADTDLSEWKDNGVTKSFLIGEAMHSSLNPGVRETLIMLKEKGFKLAVISGSLDILLDTVFPDHPFDDVFINRIFFDEGGNISRWEKTPFGDKRKGDALKMIAQREKISLSRTVFVGDHLNDISAAKIAGLSISFNSKSKELDRACSVVIRKNDMREVLKHIL